MLSENITVCIFAMNEEKRIARCIENFKGFFDNILVVDNLSIDKTCQIASDLGCRYVSIPNPGFIETPEVMEKVEAAVTTDYILIASVSEFIPFKLLESYSLAAENNTHSIVRAFRQSVTAGFMIPISGKPTHVDHTELRFFKKGSVDYSNNHVHSRGRYCCSEDNVLVLLDSEYWFYQFRDYDAGHTELKHAGYNNVLAKQMFDSGIRFSWVKMMFYASKQFLNTYIRFGSFRYGMLGFIHSIYRFWMEIGIWLRIWEWQNGFDRESVIKRNSDYRLELEDQLEDCKNEK